MAGGSKSLEEVLRNILFQTSDHIRLVCLNLLVLCGCWPDRPVAALSLQDRRFCPKLRRSWSTKTRLDNLYLVHRYTESGRHFTSALEKSRWRLKGEKHIWAYHNGLLWQDNSCITVGWTLVALCKHLTQRTLYKYTVYMSYIVFECLKCLYLRSSTRVRSSCILNGSQNLQNQGP